MSHAIRTDVPFQVIAGTREFRSAVLWNGVRAQAVIGETSTGAQGRRLGNRAVDCRNLSVTYDG
jgi:hypothetical protein